MNIIDRQTLLVSVNLLNLVPSQIQMPVNLRFAADELVLKSIVYNVAAGVDVDNVVLIWCSITNDGLIGSFANNSVFNRKCNEHFTINNTFQTGNITFQFQKTAAYTVPFYYNPQPLISDATVPVNVTGGVLSFAIEFLKHAK